MAEPVHPDGGMWGEGIAAKNESLRSDAQQYRY